MGYLRDQRGILRRYFREKAHWDNHLEKCRNFILRHVEANDAGSIAILGSGWLLDVPMDYLVQKMRKIYLIDVYHPREIRHQYKNTENIVFIEDDLTGNGIQQVYDHIKSKRKMPESTIVSILSEDYRFPFPEPDLVISLNLLNQLDILLVDYLVAKTKVSETSLAIFRKNIQQKHLDFLLRHNAILISDMMEHRIHLKTGNMENHSLIYADLPESKQVKQWIWTFDTHGYYYPGYKTNFKVKAIKLRR